MNSESGQKETPGPLNRKRSRKGSRGARSQNVRIFTTDQTDFRKNSDFGFDPCRIRTQLSPSKPAGPLSKDTLSLGGSFFLGKEVSP
jgi:hypothetical protein